jgi:glucose-6-phosphate isomerase
VVSKSGGTPEPHLGMVQARARLTALGGVWPAQAVAVTMAGSRLDQEAEANGWLRRFDMFDWVGGRTSITSAVGLLPAALIGADLRGFLEGAAAMDRCTRVQHVGANPAALLAAAWHTAGDGQGYRDMVVLPYRDRLEVFSRYLQQLVMESLGKKLDRDGRVVHQGLAVYGNKGSTDQHAYVQQLREGVNNFFVTFIEVLRDRATPSIEVEPSVTSGDYLLGFFLGTRNALFDNDRESVTLAIDSVSPRSLGMLIALYERAVGFYASLAGINAYHQPGVEAGKKAAGHVIVLQIRLLEHLSANRGKAFTVEQLAQALEAPDDVETIFHILEHLDANPDRNVVMQPAASLFDATYMIR